MLGRFIFKRVVWGIVMYMLLIITYSIIFNTVSEKTIKAQLDETIRAEKTAILKIKPDIDIDIYMNERIKYYYEINHLDKPLAEKIIRRAIKTLMFDFGKSNVMISRKGNRDVVSIILEALPLTAVLFTTSTLFTLIISLILGVKKAQIPGGKLDKFTSSVTMVLFGMPGWWLAMMFIMFFGYYLKWFPSGGIVSVPAPIGFFNRLLDFLHHLALPVFTMVILGFWGGAFVIRNVVLGIMQEDYIMTARARGVEESRVLHIHTLRAAAPPIATMILMSILGSFGGSLVLEAIFNWPGMGNLYLVATQQNDIPVLMGNLALTTALYISGIVFLDIIYGVLDPRIKVGGKI